MSNYYKKYSKNNVAKQVCTIIACVLAAVLLLGVGLQLFGKGKVKPSSWFNKESEAVIKRDSAPLSDYPIKLELFNVYLDDYSSSLGYNEAIAAYRTECTTAGKVEMNIRIYDVERSSYDAYSYGVELRKATAESTAVALFLPLADLNEEITAPITGAYWWVTSDKNGYTYEQGEDLTLYADYIVYVFENGIPNDHEAIQLVRS